MIRTEILHLSLCIDLYFEILLRCINSYEEIVCFIFGAHTAISPSIKSTECQGFPSGHLGVAVRSDQISDAGPQEQVFATLISGRHQM